VATGGGADRDGAPGPRKAGDKPRSERPSTTEIELEVSRQRSIGWAIFGVLFGGLLIWKLGTVGVWAGVVLVVMGVYHTWVLIQTLRHPPGTIVVSEREVTLPRGLCMPRPVKVAPQEITAAYFLRRSVPWNHAAPVLIVELGAKAMAFPRDWFASEADQRHVIHHLRALALGKTAAAPTAEAAVDSTPA
jgi:hypothetical protein